MSYWSLKNLLREAGWGRRLNMKMACWQRQPRLFQGIFPSSLELSLLLACGAPLPHHQNFADASPLRQTSSSSCSHSTPMRLVLKPCLTPHPSPDRTCSVRYQPWSQQGPELCLIHLPISRSPERVPSAQHTWTEWSDDFLRDDPNAERLLPLSPGYVTVWVRRRVDLVTHTLLIVWHDCYYLWALLITSSHVLSRAYSGASQWILKLSSIVTEERE